MIQGKKCVVKEPSNFLLFFIQAKLNLSFHFSSTGGRTNKPKSPPQADRSEAAAGTTLFTDNVWSKSVDIILL